MSNETPTQPTDIADRLWDSEVASALVGLAVILFLGVGYIALLARCGTVGAWWFDTFIVDHSKTTREMLQNAPERLASAIFGLAAPLVALSVIFYYLLMPFIHVAWRTLKRMV